jgi:hypothetical protein
MGEGLDRDTRENRERDLRAYAGNLEQAAEQVPFGDRGEAV